ATPCYPESCLLLDAARFLSPGFQIVPGFSCALVNTLLEVLEHVITGPHGKGDDWHGRSLVGAARKNTGVANVEIRNVVGLRPLVGHRRLGIISKPAHSSFMQTSSKIGRASC